MNVVCPLVKSRKVKGFVPHTLWLWKPLTAPSSVIQLCSQPMSAAVSGSVVRCSMAFLP